MPQNSRITGKNRQDAKDGRRRAIEAQYGLPSGSLNPRPVPMAVGEPRKLVEAHERAMKGKRG